MSSIRTTILIAASLLMIGMSTPTSATQEPEKVESDRTSEFEPKTAELLMKSAPMAKARSAWKDEAALLDQIDYQLTFRKQMDFLDIPIEELALVLTNQPDTPLEKNLGLRLSSSEVNEIERRLEIGRVVEAINDSLPNQTEPMEGEDPELRDDIAGIYQDHQNGGQIVILQNKSAPAATIKVLNRYAEKPEIELVVVDYSERDLVETREMLRSELKDVNVPGDLPINYDSDGRYVEVRVEDITKLPKQFGSSSTSPIRVIESDLFTETGNPSSLHSYSDSQPGIALAVTSANNPNACTWGFNGHSSTYLYITTAAHCLNNETSTGNNYQNWHGWATNLVEVGHNAVAWPQPRIYTHTSTYLKSKYNSIYDVARISTIYASDNCYHGQGSSNSAHCQWPMKNRARHNSWEPTVDITCASLGTSNTYRCGLILEENYNGGRKFRTAVAAIGGDSGAGMKFSNTIDGILLSASPTETLAQTAYDAKVQLEFDFNCAVGRTIRSASNWGACPTINR